MNEIRIKKPEEAQYLIDKGFQGREVKLFPSLPAYWMFENTVALRHALTEYIDNTFCKMDDILVKK